MKNKDFETRLNALLISGPENQPDECKNHLALTVEYLLKTDRGNPDQILEGLTDLLEKLKEKPEVIPFEEACKTGISFKSIPHWGDLVDTGVRWTPPSGPDAPNPMPEDDFLEMIENLDDTIRYTRGFTTIEEHGIADILHMEMQTLLLSIAWNNSHLHKYLTTEDL